MSKKSSTPLTRGPEKRPELVTVQLEVPARVFRRVSSLRTGYTVLGLVERWVEDASYGASREECPA